MVSPEPVEREEDGVSKGGNAVRSAGTTLQSIIITLTKENWRVSYIAFLCVFFYVSLLYIIEDIFHNRRNMLR